MTKAQHSPKVRSQKEEIFLQYRGGVLWLNTNFLIDSRAGELCHSSALYS
jgi:hypothetical protein